MSSNVELAGGPRVAGFNDRTNEIDEIILPTSDKPRRSILFVKSHSSLFKKKTVTISDEVFAVLVPTRDETLSFANQLYYNQSDYANFQKEATEEINQKISVEKLNIKDAIKLLYQPLNSVSNNSFSHHFKSLIYTSSRAQNSDNINTCLDKSGFQSSNVKILNLEKIKPYPNNNNNKINNLSSHPLRIIYNCYNIFIPKLTNNKKTSIIKKSNNKIFVHSKDSKFNELNVCKDDNPTSFAIQSFHPNFQLSKLDTSSSIISSSSNVSPRSNVIFHPNNNVNNNNNNISSKNNSVEIEDYESG